MAATKKSTTVKSESTSATAQAVATPVAQAQIAVQNDNKKSSKKAAASAASVAAVEQAPVAVAASVAATQAPAETKSKKAKASEAKAVESAVASTVVAVSSEAHEAVEGDDDKKGIARRIVTKQTVVDDLSTLMNKITEEIEKRAPQPASAVAASADGSASEGGAVAASKKPKRKKESGVPVKFLRTINKRLQTILNDASKMMKLKQKSTRDNTKSGLMKPVGISDDLFKFLKEAKLDSKFEIKKDGQYARVDITRMIHSYVLEHNLRKTEDMRVILPDDKLRSLLKYDPSTAKEDLTYFRLPQYLRSHFISTAPVKA